MKIPTAMQKMMAQLNHHIMKVLQKNKIKIIAKLLI